MVGGDVYFGVVIYGCGFCIRWRQGAGLALIYVVSLSHHVNSSFFELFCILFN